MLRMIISLLWVFFCLPVQAQQSLYYINTSTGIERAAFDGSNRQVIIPSDLVKAQGVSLDLENGKIYWTDWVADKIQRANLDGSDIEDLVTTGLQLPEGIALDLIHQKMYWVDSGSKKIQRANLNGAEVEDLVNYEQVNLDGIALDVAKNKMYWTEWGDGAAIGKVKRANLDGTNIRTIFMIDGVLKGIDLDLGEGKVYWTDCTFSTITRANLDGSSPEVVVNNIWGTPNGLALDLEGGKMYWTDLALRKIQRANLDGSGIEDVIIDDLDTPQGLTLISCGLQKRADCLPTATKVLQPARPALLLYPNPANQTLSIEQLPALSFLRVYDLQGRLLLQKRTHQTELTLLVGHLPNGIYQLQLRVPKQDIFSYRFQKTTP